MRPILFELDPVPVSSYFVLAAVAFAAAAAMAWNRGRALGLSSRQIGRLGWITLLFGFLGGRLGYVGLHWGDYRLHLPEIVRLDFGGMSFFGGLTAALLAVGWRLARDGKPVVAVLDRMVCPSVAALAVARIGCFLQGCCYGRRTLGWWGVTFPPETFARHPLQLYESVFLVGLLLFFLKIEKRLFRSPGSMMALYGLTYGTWRFAIGFLRGGLNPLVLGLPVDQWVGLALAAVSAIFLGPPRASGSV